MKLMGMINVGFDRFSAFVRYWEKNGGTMKQHITFLDFKRAYDSLGKDVLYNILIEFGVPMKLVQLIKMCLNET
jgi:hypothetical protein